MRSALSELESAFWNFTHADDPLRLISDVRVTADRIAAAEGESRLGKKARALSREAGARSQSYADELERRTEKESAASRAQMVAATPLRASKPTLLAWLIGLALTEFVVWVIYIAIGVSGCGGDEFGPFFARGGAASGGSVVTAAVLAGAFWLAAGVIAFRRRHALLRLLVGSIALYGVALVVLWFVSPHFWGARHC